MKRRFLSSVWIRVYIVFLFCNLLMLSHVPHGAATTENGVSQNENAEKSNPSEQTRKIYSNEVPSRKHYLRAASEMTGFLGIAAGYYWTNIGANKSDFDFDVDADNLKGRFITGDAHRFDNNELRLNVGHAAAGASYYLLARSNHLNAFESFLYTAAGSAAWEFLVEFREVVSINDNIMTPIGGFAIGEVMYQLGEFFRHSSDSAINRVLGTIFDPPATFHDWMDQTWPTASGNTDRFGFSRDVWHRFELSAGYGARKSPDADEWRSGPEVGVDLELITLDSYAKPGRFTEWYADGIFNDLTIRSAWGAGEWLDFLFFVRTAFAGYYNQSIWQGEHPEKPEGYSFFAGLGTAFEYMNHRFYGFEDKDKLAVFDILGLFVDMNVFHKGLRVRTSMDVYPSFAAVSPLGVGEFEEEFGLEGAKIILRDEGYYYALGVTTGAELEVEYGSCEFNSGFRYYYFNSIEGHDRYPEKVTDDFNLTDQRLSFSAGIGYTLPSDFLKIAFVSEKLFRDSHIRDFSSDQEETRFFSRLIFRF